MQWICLAPFVARVYVKRAIHLVLESRDTQGKSYGFRLVHYYYKGAILMDYLDLGSRFSKIMLFLSRSDGTTDARKTRDGRFTNKTDYVNNNTPQLSLCLIFNKY